MLKYKPAKKSQDNDLLEHPIHRNRFEIKKQKYTFDNDNNLLLEFKCK